MQEIQSDFSVYEDIIHSHEGIQAQNIFESHSYFPHSSNALN